MAPRQGFPFSTGPVAVHVKFVMPRPKHHYRTGRNAHLLRDSAPEYPTGKPDLDKLCRALLDSLTAAGVVKDDAQVVWLDAIKVYATFETPCARVRVEAA
jgi:crossover junction endodeoxyribonuclease RusA